MIREKVDFSKMNTRRKTVVSPLLQGPYLIPIVDGLWVSLIGVRMDAR